MTRQDTISVLPEGGDVYTVVGQNGGTYQVDGREGRCTCPDYKHNLTDDERCKHALRVAVVRGERVIPAAIERESVDPQLGQAVETTPVAVATDGGQVRTTAAGSVKNKQNRSTERPDDCGCWNSDGDLPCWPCYRDGFAEPNPNAGENNE